MLPSQGKFEKQAVCVSGMVCHLQKATVEASDEWWGELTAKLS